MIPRQWPGGACAGKAAALSQAHGRSGLCTGWLLTARERRAFLFLATLKRSIVLPKHRYSISRFLFVQLVSGGFCRYGLWLFVMQLPDRISMLAKEVFLTYSPLKLPRAPRLAWGFFGTANQPKEAFSFDWFLDGA